MNVENIRKDFSILKNRNISYLDSGATSQKPIQVIEVLKNFYLNYNANPHRGAYSLSVEATNLYEDVREKVAKFINASDPSEIVFSKNATESLNLIAYSYGLDNLKEDDEVVISIMEHHSNLVPWQRVTKLKKAKLKYMYINENYEIPIDEIRSKITDNTKIVAITHVSNVLGTINDVKSIIEYAHTKGAVVVLDASQSIPHMKIDVQNLDVDFLVFSGHKMLAPLGVGVMYGKKKLLSKMSPFLMGGEMIEYVHEQETTFAQIPNKFEAGTQDVASVIGLGAAIDYINDLGYDSIHSIENDLLEYAFQKLGELEFVTVYATQNKANHSGVISFNVNGVHPHDVASILDSVNVCVRSGNHCAQPLMRYLNIDSTCRASIYFYNTRDDIDRLIEGLQKVYKIFEKYIVK